ncbi:MAG: hypothetical protein ABL949_07125 [Fimbriimonadaceae bacterium]
MRRLKRPNIVIVAIAGMVSMGAIGQDTLVASGGAHLDDTIRNLGAGRATFGVGSSLNLGYQLELQPLGMVNVALFPEGVSHKRYLLRVIDEPTGTCEAWLSCQEKVGSTVKCLWRLKFLHSKQKRVAGREPAATGTLMKFLKEAGVVLDEGLYGALGTEPGRALRMIPGPAMATLSAVKGFAAYRFKSPALTSSYSYWFIKASGESGEASLGELGSSDTPPVLSMPYKISIEESELIAKAIEMRH